MPAASKTIKAAKKKPKLKEKASSIMGLISSKQTEELVISFCGALGSGTSVVAKRFKKELESKGYKTKYIKVSKRIRELFQNDKRLSNFDSLSKAEKTELLQTLGDELREKHGTDILSQKIIRDNALKRKIEDTEKEKTIKEGEERRTRRYVTIIDSLKHPDEYTLLEAVYGNMTYMIGVLCPEIMRMERLEAESGFTKEEAVHLTQRDKDEGFSHGQKLLKTLQKSDFFIRNAEDNIESLDKPIERYTSLILGKTNVTPTIHEYAMHAAHSASLRSGCMSRQVGAAIISADNDLIATGRNDVPRGGGGLYGPEDQENDARCAMKAKGNCQSDKRKNEITQQIQNIFTDELKKCNDDALSKIDTKNVEKLLAKINRKVEELPQLQGLIEFSRAVHAEMDAITTAARNAATSLKGSSLYCTTFPCHHCARHIVACGIKKIYYIEPYEKSLAFKLHSDSIEIDASDSPKKTRKLKIIPFEGVAPKKFYKMFAMKKRKESGTRIDIDLRIAKPLIAKFLYNSLEFESVVATYYDENVEKKLS